MRDNDDLHIVEEDSNGKEDSQTPTDKGSIMDEDECAPSNSKLASDVSSLKKQCTVLSHQMNLIMGRLGLPRCPCPTCIDHIRSSQQHQQQGLPPPMRLPCNGAPAAPPQGVQGVPTSVVCPSGTPVAIPITNGIRIINPSGMLNRVAPPPITPVTPKETPTMEGTPSENGSTSTEGEIKEVSVIQSPQSMAAANMMLNHFIHAANTPTDPNAPPNPFAEQNHGGRKSKYCTPELKKLVAEYASEHGAAYAARKFGIPPSVAAYYQRKLAKIKHQEKQAQVLAGVAPIQITSDSMPSTADSFDSPHKNLDCTPGTPTTPSFLRGRGRGRPKLIGDELDADLIEYMVKLKTDNPTLHLNPANALEIARSYIMKHSPNILAENGGNVNLKITWAMKLVSRISERQKEIELGLPAGFLANYGRMGLQNLNTMNAGANMLSSVDLNAIFSQLAKMQSEQFGIMPEITNVKELNLSDFTFGDDSMNEDKDKDGSTTPDATEEEEKAMESIQSCQSSLAAF